jgi:hypothetical protein
MFVVSIEACSVKDVALANLAKALAAEKVCRGNECMGLIVPLYR